MDHSEVNKTSDEIINELFSSLNVPLSPKVTEVEERLTSKAEQLSAHTGDSENSEDDESDSKSSESEGETKPIGGEMQGNRAEKLKSQKKKKDKRKKKKKHRKKEDGGRHKHKKKKKKENFETAEEAKLAGDILQDVKLKNQAVIQKIMIHEEMTSGAVDDEKHEKRKSRSKSPRLLDARGQVDEVDNKKKLVVQESQNACEEILVSNKEGAVSLPVVSEDSSCFPEGASKSDIQPCPTHERSPEAESVSRSLQVSPTEAAGEHKRKHLSHSCSPSPVKKQKSSSSVSPPESSSPKAACRLRSPDSAERSRSVKDTPSCRRTKSRSPLVKQSAQSDRSGSKSRRSRSRSRKRSESEKRSGSRNRSTSKSRKKLDSRIKKRSRSRSKKRSRSRSRKSRSRSRRSRSRSRRRSRSRSRRKARSSSKSRRGSKSRRRSRSKSKRRSMSKSKRRSRSKSKRRSRSKSKRRSRSRSKSRRSRSKSSKRSGSKSGRKSASKSNRSKSRERSRSRSRRRSGLRGVRSRSGSRSQSRQRSSSKCDKRSGSSVRRRSRSRSKSRRSRSRGSQSYGRSRSRSSHKSSPAKERFDMFAVMRERASRLAELKNQGIPDGSLGSLLLSAAVTVPSGGGGGGGVPQSVPTSDPSSIPLPQKDLLQADTPPRDEAMAETIVAMEEDKPVGVAEDTVSMLSPEQDASKARDGSKSKQDEGSEKGKMKTIITIKSLKDSLVFQQAQEEAERKAKEIVDLPAGHDNSSATDRKAGHKQGSTERHHQDEAKQDESTSLEGKEKYYDRKDRAESEENIKKYRKEEKEKGDEKSERKQSEEKRKGESYTKEMHIETEVLKQKAEIEDREPENNTHTKKSKTNTQETDIEAKITSRKITVTKTKEREEEKESKHSSKIEKEERKGSKQSSKVKEDGEHDGNKRCSELEEDKGKKQSTKTDEEDGKKIKLTSKADKAEESKGHKLVNKVVEGEGEDEDKVTKQSSRAEGKEEEVTTNYSSSKREEEERRNKQLSKTEEKEEEKLSKLSSRMEEDKSKGSKSSSKAEEREEGMKSRHSSKIEDKEDSRGSKELSKDVSGKNGHSHPEGDPADKIEEGEITSDKEEEEIKPPSKSHSKKSKKDKYSSKEKKRSHKDKSKNKEEKKKAHDKKKEQEKTRSKATHKSRQHSSNSGSKEHSHSRRHRKHSHSRSRSRSRSRDHSSRQHRRSHSRSRSKSRSKRRRESTSDLRDKVTRKRLLEIARRNAVYLMQNGCLPPSVEKEQLVKIKAGGKSVDELTDFCKQLVASGNYSDVDVSEPSMSSEEENSSEKPFSSTRHPFSVRDSKPILMNIRNAPMLPTKTNAERLAGQAKLREQFPVSSGSQHRTKESEWVPVTPKEKKEEDKVFIKPEAPSVDISQIVSTRLSAMRKLQDNPNDSEAIKTLNNVQKEMQNWALSKQEPGQFTGTTGVKVLSQEELSAGHQAWARKEQFKEAAPVRPHFGLKMLQKMGWSPGEGLGKNKEGTTEPLLLDVKMDKKGFHAQEEVTPKKQPIPLVKDLSGKHPVSALVELCSKRKWSPPDFEMVFDCGPDHKKNFLMKVMVNGQEFKPSVAASTKKMAKANAAAAYLQSLGLYPKDPRYPL